MVAAIQMVLAQVVAVVAILLQLHALAAIHQVFVQAHLVLRQLLRLVIQVEAAQVVVSQAVATQVVAATQAVAVATQAAVAAATQVAAVHAAAVAAVAEDKSPELKRRFVITN